MNKSQRIIVSPDQLRRIVAKILREGIEDNNVLYSYDANFLKFRRAETLKILNILFFGVPGDPNKNQTGEVKILDLSYRDLVAKLDKGELSGQDLSRVITVVLADRKGPSINVGGDIVPIEDFIANLNSIVEYLTAENSNIETVYKSLEIILGGRPLDYVPAAATPGQTETAPTFASYGPGTEYAFDPVTGYNVPVGEPTQVVNVKEGTEALIDQGAVTSFATGMYKEFVGQSVKPLADKAEKIRDIMIGIKGLPNYLNAQNLYDIGKILEQSWDADVNLGYAGVSSNVAGSCAVVATANSLFGESRSAETWGITVPVILGVVGGILAQNTVRGNIANIPIRSYGLEMKLRLNTRRLARDKISIKNFFGEDDPLYAEIVKAEEELREIQKKINDANAEAEAALGVIRTATGSTGDEAAAVAAQVAKSEAGAAALEAEKKYKEAQTLLKDFRKEMFAQFERAREAFASIPPARGPRSRRSRGGAPPPPQVAPVEPTEADILAQFAKRYPDEAAILSSPPPAKTARGLEAQIAAGDSSLEALRTARAREEAAKSELEVKRGLLNAPDKARTRETLDQLKQNNKELIDTVLANNAVLEQLKTMKFINDPTKNFWQKFWMNFGARLGTGGNFAHYFAWTTGVTLVLNVARAIFVEGAKMNAAERLMEKNILEAFKDLGKGPEAAPDQPPADLVIRAGKNYIADFADDWVDASWTKPATYGAGLAKLKMRGVGSSEITTLALQIANFSTNSLSLSAQQNDVDLLKNALKAAEPYVKVVVEKDAEGTAP